MKCMTNACRAGVKDALISAAAVDCQSDDACQVSSPSAKRHCPDARSAVSVLDDLLGVRMKMMSRSRQRLNCTSARRSSAESVDPFVWWKANASRFPRLAAQPSGYLRISATSVPSRAGLFICRLSGGQAALFVVEHYHRCTDLPPLQCTPTEDQEGRHCTSITCHGASPYR